MAVSAPETEEKRSHNTTVVLQSLKSIGNLRERYTEDTADLFFVEKETKERLPAHREVLKVASPVFYRMFSGDWKEKEEKEIPAPEDFSWKLFKATIALLYGEEVEVEESAITDLYRVAHYYDLRAVISVLAHSIQVWDHRQLSTVVELCTLAGQVETEEEQKENEVIQAAARYIAQELDDSTVRLVDISGLSYQTMLKLVQCDQISTLEQDVLTTLNLWMDAHPEVSMGKAKELFSHVRYGTLPFYCLLQCRVGQSSLDMAFSNHHGLSINRLKDNLSQITPREGQEEVFLVCPLTHSLNESVQMNVIKFYDIATSPAVALICSGKQEIVCELTLQFTVQKALTAESFLDCQLCSVANGKESGVYEIELRETDGNGRTGKHVEFKRVLVRVNYNGCCLTLYADTEDSDNAISKAVDMDFWASYPWLLTFGVRGANGNYNLSFQHRML